jgi:hypothetical protein
MKNPSKFFYTMLFVFIYSITHLFADSSDDNSVQFAIYLVKDCDTCSYDPGGYKINSLELHSVPVITSNDLEWYDWSTHEFSFRDSLSQLQNYIYNQPYLKHKKYFVVVAGDERVYLGVFWSGYSSQMTYYPHIWLPFIIKRIRFSGRNKLNDPRNDQRILKALKIDGILKE